MNNVIALISRDPILRAVEVLRNRQKLTAQLGAVWDEARCNERIATAKVVQTGYWPGKRARLVMKANVVRENGKSSKRFFYAQLYPDAKSCLRRLASALEKAGHYHHSRPPVFALPELNAVVWTLPNGPLLGRARLCFSSKKFRVWWTKIGLANDRTAAVEAPELKRYVPRGRVLFRSSHKAGKAAYIKFYTKGIVRQAVANLAMVNEMEKPALGFRVPRILAIDRQARVVVMEEVPGRVLSELFGDHRALGAVGVALARLHESQLRPPTKWAVTAEVAALRRAMADVRLALPQSADSLDQLVERIEREAATLDFTACRPIHGNLFGDQILIDCGNVALVDWDDLCAGDPLYDLGRLIAHMIYAGLAKGTSNSTAERTAVLVAAYESHSAAKVDPIRLRWHIVAALLMRAKISGLRPLSKGWRRTTKAAIAEAEFILSGTRSWAAAA